MPPPVPQATCVHCGKNIDAGDAHCRHCGRRQGGGDAWYYSTFWVATLAFLVIGPFALILVWKSTRMSAVAKRVLTILIVAYTVVTAYLFYVLVAIVLAQLAELGQVMSDF